MVITAGRIKPSLEALGAIFADGTISYDIADQVSDLIVALDGGLKKLA